MRTCFSGTGGSWPECLCNQSTFRKATLVIAVTAKEKKAVALPTRVGSARPVSSKGCMPSCAGVPADEPVVQGDGSTNDVSSCGMVLKRVFLYFMGILSSEK